MDVQTNEEKNIRKSKMMSLVAAARTFTSSNLNDNRCLFASKSYAVMRCALHPKIRFELDMYESIQASRAYLEKGKYFRIKHNIFVNVIIDRSTRQLNDMIGTKMTFNIIVLLLFRVAPRASKFSPPFL